MPQECVRDFEIWHQTVGAQMLTVLVQSTRISAHGAAVDVAKDAQFMDMDSSMADVLTVAAAIMVSAIVVNATLPGVILQSGGAVVQRSLMIVLDVCLDIIYSAIACVIERIAPITVMMSTDAIGLAGLAISLGRVLQATSAL